MVFSFDVLLSRLQEAKVLKKMRIEDISKKSNVPSVLSQKFLLV